MRQSIGFVAATILVHALGNPIPPPISDELCMITLVETIQSPQTTPPPSTVTVTEYESTVTTRAGVDCSGCVAVTKVTLDVDYDYTSSQDPIVEHVTVLGPATTTVTHCLPSLAIGYDPNNAPVTEPQTIVPHRRNIGETTSTETAAPSGEASETGCTRYVFPFPTLVWGPTSTLYSATETITQSIDCGGCSEIATSYGAFGVPPVVHFNTTVTGVRPATATAFACRSSSQTTGITNPILTVKPSPSIDYYEAPPLTAYTELPRGNASPTCTISKVVGPYIPQGGTRTVWTATETMTSNVDCGACALVWETGVVNFFAEVIFTTRTTAAEPTTRRVMACSN